MALFNWLGKKKTDSNTEKKTPAPQVREKSAAPPSGKIPRATNANANDAARSRFADSVAASTLEDSKQSRSAKRDSLVALIRAHAMQMGVLSSSYKLKVLSAGPSGAEYLALFDILPSPDMEQIAQQISQSVPELTQAARSQLKLEIQGVYWQHPPLERSSSIHSRPSAFNSRPYGDSDGGPASVTQAMAALKSAENHTQIQKTAAAVDAQATAFAATIALNPAQLLAQMANEKIEKPPQRQEDAPQTTFAATQILNLKDHNNQ